MSINITQKSYTERLDPGDLPEDLEEQRPFAQLLSANAMARLSTLSSCSEEQLRAAYEQVILEFNSDGYPFLAKLYELKIDPATSRLDVQFKLHRRLNS